MNKRTLSALALAATVGIASASGLDLQSRIILQRSALQKAQENNIVSDVASDSRLNLKSYSPGKTVAGESVLAMVKLNEGFDRADLEAAGAEVLAIRGAIAIVRVITDQVEEVAQHPAVKKLSIEKAVKPMMDLARAASGVDDIHAGAAGLDVPYTGKGVLAAIVDQGVDPNHIAFLNEKGKSRVCYLTDYLGSADSSGNPIFDMYGDDIYDIDENGNVFWYPEVSKFTTDALTAYHGTHTMNILAGGYKGSVQVAKGLNGTTPVLESKPNPYYGVATDASLAVSCGSLSDACIAYGINGLLDFAAYNRETSGMPSVLSLSLGSTTGPHDKMGLMNQFLAECGDETIVVIAAGNEGDLKIALNKTLTADDNSVATMIYPYGYRYDSSKAAGTNNTYYRNGAVYVYSNDETPFTLRAFVMTGTAGNYRRRATFDISGEEGNYYLSSDYYAQYVGGSVNSTVSRYFDGYIGGGSMYDKDLKRYWGVVDYYLFTNPETGFNEDGSEGVIIGFEVVGADGQRIDCYCDGDNTWMSNYGMADYQDGSRDGSISDMAVGDNVLVVGAYTLRNRWTNLNGEDYGYLESDGIVVNDIGQYSSYGTLSDGRTLPHVCAPGTAVASAMSTPYVESYFKGYEQYIPMNFIAKTEANGRTYYWKTETGTSMSTPFVAGSIALWLEADPTLTIDEVKDIIARTSVSDDYVKKGNPTQWGAGKFDALAGLKEVIRNSAGIQGVVSDSHNDRLILTPAGPAQFDVFVGDAPYLDIKVYNISGACVFSASVDGCETSLDLSSLSAGVYAVAVNGHSKKIALR